MESTFRGAFIRSDSIAGSMVGLERTERVSDFRKDWMKERHV